MAAKFLIILSVVIGSCLGGLVPAVPAVAAVPAAYSVPYASSYSANVINHAIAAPFAQPLVAGPAAPFLAAPGISPIAAYSALSYPYAAAPLIAG